ncbi:hypothetical protein [Acrocarpospora sp. B8E8]|uniref:hypothetical protein n=1 Tax=Acrocarpospora sp. B8E8 TaxID=3153572 RepID=UPI00325E60D8
MTAWAWILVQRVTDELAGRITSGELAPGAPVPTEAELRDTHSIQPAQASWIWRQLQKRRLAHMTRRRVLVVGPPDAQWPSKWTPPIERRIAEVVGVLVRRIRAGEIAVHERVATQEQLRSGFGISREVATEVRYRLEDLGWAYSIPHYGIFAAPADEWPAQGGGE